MAITGKSTLQDVIKNKNYKNFTKDKFSILDRDVLAELVMHLIQINQEYIYIISNIPDLVSKQVSTLNTQSNNDLVSLFTREVSTSNTKLHSDLISVMTKQVSNMQADVEQVYTDMNVRMKEMQVNFDTELNTLRTQLKLDATKPDDLEIEAKPKHAILISQTESAHENEENFMKEAWNAVLKKSITDKLTQVQIKKATFTKSGKGYIEFPDQDSRDKAQDVLKESYNVEVSTKTKTMLYPKIKLCNIDCERYTAEVESRDKLRKAILSKNHVIRNMVNDKEMTFDVIVIQPEGDGTWISYCKN